MSKIELLRHLYAYNEWANDKLLDTADNLPDDTLNANKTSFGSVIATMAHMVGAQEIWRSRWVTGKNPPGIDDIRGANTMAAVKAAFAQSHEALRGYVAGLIEQDVDRKTTYHDSGGNRYDRVLWQLMVHAANHNTYHRGEAAAALSALGQSSGDLDFVYWERRREDGHA